MRTTFLFLIASLLFFSCEPKESLPSLDGSYVGTYVRGDSVSVIALTIDDYRYEGLSEYALFPGICMGTVAWTDYVIEFGDECEWDNPEGFDNTLILHGRYKYAYSNKKLSFWRGEGDYREIYTIEKLPDEN